MDVLRKVNASTILENLIASVILMVIFILAGNALNNSFKTSIDSRDLNLHNSVKKTEYLLLYNKLQLPQSVESNKSQILFSKDDKTLVIQTNTPNESSKRTVCCIEEP